MSTESDHKSNLSTVTLISLSHVMVSRKVSDRVAEGGFSITNSHSAVFGQMTNEGARLTDLAKGANMTPQAMGQLVDELETQGYLKRRPDPTDRRAKIIELTALGRQCVQAGIKVIEDMEKEIADMLGPQQRHSLRSILEKLLAADS
jgi:DNA-binding MarR family transcriptional regulator